MNRAFDDFELTDQSLEPFFLRWSNVEGTGDGQAARAEAAAARAARADARAARVARAEAAAAREAREAREAVQDPAIAGDVDPTESKMGDDQSNRDEDGDFDNIGGINDDYDDFTTITAPTAPAAPEEKKCDEEMLLRGFESMDAKVKRLSGRVEHFLRREGRRFARRERRAPRWSSFG